MRKRIVLILLLSLSLSFACHNVQEKSEDLKKKTNYLVVLSMDGFRWDYTDGLPTPNFDRMAQKGAFARVQSSFPTKTFPNHYTIATGLYPDNHGLVNNIFYDPERQETYKIADRAKVQDGYYYQGEPIWNSAEKQGVKAATYFWVGSEADVQGMRPSIWKIYDKNIGFNQRADSVISWLQLPMGKRPKLIMWYVDQPDGVGHNFGPKSAEANNMVIQLDSLLGYFLDQLETLPQANQVNFILTSDHGMSKIDDQRMIPLGENLPGNWLQRYTGANPVVNLWSKEGYHDSLMLHLAKIKHLKAYDSLTIPEHLHYMTNPRCGDIVVVADPGWSLTKSSYDHVSKGTHGYDPNFGEMDVIFYAMGPDFKENYKGKSFQNVDIYNLMAHLLHLEPAPNDGDRDAFELLKP
jgi:predicted AlkP superfamily pyrophosphatase or phosphodiesterase